ncbi:MAG TPA: HEAT repeat domain-containing protein [Aggregatilinea sp.]|uniref:HEAT repeat domain-containing protein n=1 Tax=Aggregatilinea sp. TaxID=2806333 RepID=UPI002D0DCC80|nr:HEAT repeat domain-containing protein [Aggregatilinea sp.]HML23838.1 HEAT repeat domain-containing protein [Aggregatilinea sp.]
MDHHFRAKLHDIVATLDPRVRAHPQRCVDGVLGAGVDSYRALLALIRDQTATLGLREAACWVALQLNDLQAIPALLTVVQDAGDRFEIRQAAARALGIIADPRSVDGLAVLLDAPGDPLLRFLAAYALSVRGDDRALPPLIARLNDRSEPPYLRSLAAEALATVAHKDEDGHAFTALMAALGDPVVEVRFWATFALGALSDTRAIPALERVAATDQGVAFGQRSVRQEAVKAIEGIRAWEQCCLEFGAYDC